MGTTGPDGLTFSGTVEFGLAGHRQQLRQLVEMIPAEHSAFVGDFRGKRVRNVLPRIRARVRFTGWDAGVLREAIFEAVTIVE